MDIEIGEPINKPSITTKLKPGGWYALQSNSPFIIPQLRNYNNNATVAGASNAAILANYSLDGKVQCATYFDGTLNTFPNTIITGPSNSLFVSGGYTANIRPNIYNTYSFSQSTSSVYLPFAGDFVQPYLIKYSFN